MSLWSKLKTFFNKGEQETDDSYMSNINPRDKPTVKKIQTIFNNSSDIIHRTFPEINVDYFYITHLVDKDIFERDVIRPLCHVSQKEVGQLLQRSTYEEAKTIKEVVNGVLNGDVVIFHKGKAFLVNVFGPEKRSVERSETETVVTGPHDAFVENAQTNLSLIRKRLKTPQLKVMQLVVGRLTRTNVYIMYLEDVVSDEVLQDLKERIEKISIDGIYDTNMLVQYIDDAPNSIFPQFQTSERPDVAVAKLVEGKIVGLVDGSPYMFSAPTGFFEFFQSPDDYYQRWILGTATRFLRFVSLIITLGFTALYVSVTTFHYEMIPEAMLVGLAESRIEVPFPPVYEALMMEFTIELLREAGARLPNKIGQTIGIVGGIVIGQAAVDAGITSNILVIAVAVSALASFTIPNYIMSTSLRIARFGLILLAGFLGNVGLMLGIGLLVIHLSGITNVKTPYLNPAAPVHVKDWKDTFIRGPYWAQQTRPTQSKSKNKVRQTPMQ